MGRILRIAVGVGIGIVLSFGEVIGKGEMLKGGDAYCFLAKIYKECQELAEKKGYTTGDECRDEGAAVALVVVGEASKKGIVGSKLTNFGGVIYSICTKGCLKDAEVEEKLRKGCPSQFQQ